MDTGKKYIEMCDCEEIQGNAPKEKGDVYYILTHRENGNCDVMLVIRNIEYYDCNGFTYGESHKGGVCWHKESHITTNYYQDDYGMERTKKILWLPRQDQLQEILKPYPFSALLRDVRMFWKGGGRYCNSMEQLWLAFVMKEKFNKIWNESKWIKQ